MKKIVIAIITSLFVSYGLNAQVKQTVKPKNISEAVWQINDVLTEDQKMVVRSVSEQDFMEGTSSALGKWIQQEWLYDKNAAGARLPSELKKYMIELGVKNDNNMSFVILKTFYRWFHGQELELIETVAEIRAKEAAAQ